MSHMDDQGRCTECRDYARDCVCIIEEIEIGICDYCENVTDINSEGWCQSCSQ